VTLAVVGRWFGSELMQLTSLAFTMIPGVGR
jgi:type III secretion protein S